AHFIESWEGRDLRMSRGFKVLAALAIVGGMAFVTDGLYAACNGEGHLGYSVIQCGQRSWFNAPPAGSGTVSVAWWQLGFGNRNVSNGGAPTGTAFVLGTGFIGNDSGSATAADLDMQSAAFVGGPAGSTCFSSSSNWITAGIDGCADDSRDGAT